MAALTIRDVSRRSGLSEPTLRYYEEIGLIGPIARDESSGHRRYRTEDLDELQILACMRALGVGIEDMRVYQANRARGHSAAAEQRDLLLRHAERIEAEIAAQYARLGYLREKAADDAGLEVVEADLMADDGWKAAVAGCEEIHHVATPFPAVQPEDPDELIVPARDGT